MEIWMPLFIFKPKCIYHLISMSKYGLILSHHHWASVYCSEFHLFIIHYGYSLGRWGIEATLSLDIIVSTFVSAYVSIVLFCILLSFLWYIKLGTYVRTQNITVTIKLLITQLSKTRVEDVSVLSNKCCMFFLMHQGFFVLCGDMFVQSSKKVLLVFSF